jgi:hypothetical protein
MRLLVEYRRGDKWWQWIAIELIFWGIDCTRNRRWEWRWQSVPCRSSRKKFEWPQFHESLESWSWHFLWKNKVWKVRVGNFLSKIKFGKLELGIWMKVKVWKLTFCPNFFNLWTGVLVAKATSYWWKHRRFNSSVINLWSLEVCVLNWIWMIWDAGEKESMRWLLFLCSNADMFTISLP